MASLHQSRSRNSILKNSGTTQHDKTVSRHQTATHNVRFIDQSPIRGENKQDNVGQNETPDQVYQRITIDKQLGNIPHAERNSKGQSENLLKDVNYLNNLYSHILVMIGSNVDLRAMKNIQKLQHRPNHFYSKLVKQIQNIILDNIAVKERVNLKHSHMLQVLKMAEYLRLQPEQMIMGKQFSELVKTYQRNWTLVSQLRKQFDMVNAIAKSYFGKVDISDIEWQRIKQKEQKVKRQKTKIEREKRLINNLKAEQESLVKKLRNTQKEYLKNERSTSNLKMKIIQLQNKNQLLKRRDHSKDKENINGYKQNRKVADSDPIQPQMIGNKKQSLNE